MILEMLNATLIAWHFFGHYNFYFGLFIVPSLPAMQYKLDIGPKNKFVVLPL
jgi:hypothetical protein